MALYVDGTEATEVWIDDKQAAQVWVDGTLAFEKTLFTPWESHMGFDLIGGTGSVSPTTFDTTDSGVALTSAISAGDWYAVFSSWFGDRENAAMECNLQYINNGTTHETYPLARGTDINNFVGVTVWNGEYKVYERIDGVWKQLTGILAPATTVGAVMRMEFNGTNVEVFVEGTSIGSAVTRITTGFYGTLLRAHPTAETIMTNYTIS